MKIGILSDLHMEFAPFVWEGLDVDVLVLAGDIANGAKGVEWAERVIPEHIGVLYVPGNHEFYGWEYGAAIDAMRRAARGSHVSLLDNEAITFGGVKFIGSTLWTDYRLGGVPEAKRLAQYHMADHKLITCRPRHGGGIDEIEAFTPDIAEEAFHENQAFLADQMSFPPLASHRMALRHVVITHHAPHPNSIHPRYAGDPLNPAFASDMTAFIQQHQPELWIHGHTHATADYRVGRTRIISNPRGYPLRVGAGGGFENSLFNPDPMVEIA